MAYKAGVIGASGFAGIELLRILYAHPGFSIAYAISNSFAGMDVSELYPDFLNRDPLKFSPQSETDLHSADVVFLALPHTESMRFAPKLKEAGCAVIDLSADFRLRNKDVYERWYETEHLAPELLEQAAFGLPELFRDDLDKAAAKRGNGEGVIVACAGCYPTATSLAAYPALRSGCVAEGTLVVADAVSGVSGAGRKPSQKTHFCSADEDVQAYSVCTHRHSPEIEQILGAEGRLVFTPHLGPYKQGILSTVTMQVDAAKAVPSAEELVETYRDFYAGSTFVRVLEPGRQPRTSAVENTNFAHIGLASSPGSHAIVVTCAIDNLVKGAAGQAVQCANIVVGYPEGEGLMP